MKILVVSATVSECRLDIGGAHKIGIPHKAADFNDKHVDVLISGVGAVPMVFALTKYAHDYDLVINIGIAGSYNTNLSIGDVVCVSEDTFGDYGIDDNGVFKPLSGINFAANVLYSVNNFMNNPWLNGNFSFIKLPFVKGLTLSTVSGSEDAIGKIKSFWNADIETMEGASVFYVCKQLNVPFMCFRAISNMVEPRNKLKWEASRAIENLDKELRGFIQNLL